MLSSLNNIIFSIPTQMVYCALILYVTALLHNVSGFILYCTFYHELTLRLSIIYKCRILQVGYQASGCCPFDRATLCHHERCNISSGNVIFIIG